MKQKIKDFLFKMLCLFSAGVYTYDQWKEEVWDVEDLDEPFCCNGRECGCQATSYRTQIKWNYLGK